MSSISRKRNHHNLQELHLYAANITSLADLKDLTTFTNLQSLSLHANHISRIENLHMLVHLKDLDLSSNNISKIEGLDQLVELESLNLANNQISTLDGLSSLKRLQKLVVPFNRIISLQGLSQLHGYEYALQFLDARGNCLEHPKEFNHLHGCVVNGYCYQPKYVLVVLESWIICNTGEGKSCCCSSWEQLPHNCFQGLSFTAVLGQPRKVLV